MVSDAISHAVLPGIVIAFLLGGSMDSLWMLVGAGIFGILTTFLIEFFHSKGRLQTDASIGVTFTWLFALGIILVSYYAGDAHIDEECVLYGEIAYVPLDLMSINSYVQIPKAIVILSTVMVINILIVLVGYKEFILTTFDPVFALSIGISSSLWHYLLMSLVSLTTVAAFESVGAILVVAYLITPAATAYLISRTFKKMIGLSIGFGISSAVLGYYLAVWMDGSIAGAMATVAGLQFATVFAASQWTKKRDRRKALALTS